MEHLASDFRCLTHHSSKYHDIFISYRVNTEKKLADKIALLLDGYTKEGGQKVRTFLDSNCLLDGGDWEKNFLSALHHTTLLVLLISEDGLDLRSASYPHLTKIQAADKEQDNCLLEYEYALDLEEKGLVDIFVLTVSKDEKLGGTFCRAKFPSTPAEIQKRLLMYSDTQEHHHRDDTKGPRVSETMAKLLGHIAPTKRGSLPTYAHIDPDDAASRISDILIHLRHADAKLDFKKKHRRLLDDTPFLKQKIAGFFLGAFLPLISLMSIMTARNVQWRAIRYGVLLGHVFDLVVLAIIALVFSFLNQPDSCVSLSLCIRDYYGGLGFQEKWEYTTWLCYAGVNTCLDERLLTNKDCALCFCDAYLYWCDGQQNNQRVFLFLGLVSLFIAGLVYVVASFLKKKETSKRNTGKV